MAADVSVRIDASGTKMYVTSNRVFDQITRLNTERFLVAILHAYEGDIYVVADHVVIGDGTTKDTWEVPIPQDGWYEFRLLDIPAVITPVEGAPEYDALKKFLVSPDDTHDEANLGPYTLSFNVEYYDDFYFPRSSFLLEAQREHWLITDTKCEGKGFWEAQRTFMLIASAEYTFAQGEATNEPAMKRQAQYKIEAIQNDHDLILPAFPEYSIRNTQF